MVNRNGLSSLGIALVCLVIVAMPAPPAQARTLSYASVYPAGSDADKAVLEWAERLKIYSDDDLSAKVYAMSLLSASELSGGIRDGLADVGYLLTAYFPAEYPHINLLNESSMRLNLYDKDRLNGLGTYAFQGAITEFIFFDCPECLKELTDQNQVYTANVASSAYALICNQAVVKPADLAGLRIRVAGSHWSRWVSRFGGSSVSMTISDLREGLGQGVLDCTISSLPDVINLNLTEVVSDVTLDLPGGIYAGSSGASMNRDVWRSLSEDQRRAVLRAGADLTAITPWRYEITQQVALDAIRERGGNIHTGSVEFHRATEAFVKEDMDAIVDYYEERYGIERAEEILTAFSGVLDKWVDLVQGVETREQLADLYYQRIFKKVDVTRHGL